LDAFAVQLARAGWSPITRTANDVLGSETYARTDSGGRQLQAALTLYRSSTVSDVYAAFIDVTNLSARTTTADKP